MSGFGMLLEPQRGPSQVFTVGLMIAKNFLSESGLHLGNQFSPIFLKIEHFLLQESPLAEDFQTANKIKFKYFPLPLESWLTSSPMASTRFSCTGSVAA